MLNSVRAYVLVVLTAFLAVAPVSARAQELPAGVSHVAAVEGIDEYRLSNGLQVLLNPAQSKPTTTVNLTVHVGSRQENYGETGMAHLLEHMMFKGTPTHPQVWAEFEKRGLAANGSTWYDRTNYTARFSANDANLKWYLGWLADAMVNSSILRKDLDTEMTVVRNEMEMGENSPGRILLQRTMALMFDWHNYGNSTIGARSDVENVDIPRLRAFYHLYYQPDNATLVVSGKFDAREVLAWVADTFGKTPRPTRKLPTLYTLDPAQDGERSVTLRRVGGAPMIYAGYHVPAGAAPDFAAVQMLELILGDTPSGRLYKRLTDQKLAASAFSFAFSLHDPGVLFAGAQLAPGQDVARAREALLETVESFGSNPVTAEELARARQKWLNDWDQTFANPEAVGMALSEPISLGDWRLFFLMRDRVRDITLAEVQRVAEAYLLESNRTVAIYLPTDKPQRAPAPANVDIATVMQDFKPQAAVSEVESFEATPANIDARTQTQVVGGIKTALLPKETRGEVVNAVLTLHFGDAASLAGKNEIGDAVAALLDKGTATLSRQQVQDRLDALRTELSVSASPGRVSVGLRSRREQLPEAIALVGELLRRPALPAEALGELKRQSLAAIAQQRKEPRAIARNTQERLANPYPRDDVRHVPTFDEMVQDVEALDLDKLRAFHDRFYGAAHAEFAAVGAMDADKVRAALKAAVGDWNAGAPFTRIEHPLVNVEPQRLMLDTPDKQNATMLVRQALPISDDDADYAALMMADQLLGGGGSSRLWRRIREAEGLSYGVGSRIGWSSLDENSTWQAYAIFAPQNRAKVETSFREEVARALKEGFTAKELAEGKTSLLNFRRLARAQDAGLAGALAHNLYLGRTFAISARVDAQIEALTLEQVNAALRKYLKPDRFVAVYAGDFKP